MTGYGESSPLRSNDGFSIKNEARRSTFEFLKHLTPGPAIGVRINSVDTNFAESNSAPFALRGLGEGEVFASRAFGFFLRCLRDASVSWLSVLPPERPLEAMQLTHDRR